MMLENYGKEICMKRLCMKDLFRQVPQRKENPIPKEQKQNAMPGRKIHRSRRSMLYPVLGLVLLALLVFGAVRLIRHFSGEKSNFAVSDTILNVRSVNPEKVKLYGEDNKKVSTSFTVCIDPGHGGEEPGEVLEDAEGTIIRSEKMDTMELGQLLEERLKSAGVNVIMTRTGDTKHSNQERCEFANQNGANLFVSLHRNNESDDPAKKGVEIYVPSKKLENSEISFQTGEYIMQYLDAMGISQNGGTHYGSVTSEQYDFQLNRDTAMASVVIELGYISNEEDNLLFDINKERYASAIAYGILKQYAPDLVGQTAEPAGHIRKNSLIFDYASLSDEDITYAVEPSDRTDFQSYLPEIRNFETQYGGFASEFIIDSTENSVYLTFDVGTDAGNVREILDILDRQEVKAVFFVNYTFAVNHPDLMREMIAKGHTIGNGSRDFPVNGFAGLEEEKQIAQIFDLHEYVLFHYNYCMSLFRFPNGHFSQKLLAMLNNYQYISIFWSFSYNDYTALGFSDAEILDAMNAAVSNGIIYDLRTDSETDLSVLNQFISNVKQKGCQFGLLY